MSDTYKHIISSAVATFIAEISTLPICTVKTNYQNQVNTKFSIPTIIQNIWSRNGIRGFYQASVWATSSQVLSTTAKYTLYQHMKKYIPNIVVAGLISGLLSTIITHPFDVVKFHYQNNASKLPQDQTSFLTELRRLGCKILYRGYRETLLKTTVGSITYFPLHDFWKSKVKNTSLAALLSAVMSATIMQPFDYAKTRKSSGYPYFCGWNPRPYFKGLSLNLARVVPHFIIIMTLIEYIKNHI